MAILAFLQKLPTADLSNDDVSWPLVAMATNLYVQFQSTVGCPRMIIQTILKRHELDHIKQNYTDKNMNLSLLS